MMTSPLIRKSVGAATALVIGGAATAAVVFAQNAAESAAGIGQTRSADTATATPADTATPSASPTATPSASPTASATTRYKNGTYTATGSYSSPGGDEQIGVTLTLANDTISRLSVDTSSASGPAEQFQSQFAEGIDALVVGKRLDQVSVSRVSGSSLTSAGFNKALATIAAHARR